MSVSDIRYTRLINFNRGKYDITNTKGIGLDIVSYPDWVSGRVRVLVSESLAKKSGETMTETVVNTGRNGIIKTDARSASNTPHVLTQLPITEAIMAKQSLPNFNQSLKIKYDNQKLHRPNPLSHLHRFHRRDFSKFRWQSVTYTDGAGANYLVGRNASVSTVRGQLDHCCSGG